MITQILKFTVNHDQSESFKQALCEDKKIACSEIGLFAMRFFEDRNNQEIFFSYECWKDQAAMDNHRELLCSENICTMIHSALQKPVEVLTLNENSSLREPNPEEVLEAIEKYVNFVIEFS